MKSKVIIGELGENRTNLKSFLVKSGVSFEENLIVSFGEILIVNFGEILATSQGDISMQVEKSFL